MVDAVGSNRMLNYTQTLSDLVDLDYADAISEYSLRQVGMQAAQKALWILKVCHCLTICKLRISYKLLA